MVVAVMTLRLYAPWVHSLKEKRMELKSLLAKVRAKFNVSAIESGEQDVHQTLELSIAALAADTAQGDSILDTVLAFYRIQCGGGGLRGGSGASVRVGGHFPAKKSLRAFLFSSSSFIQSLFPLWLNGSLSLMNSFSALLLVTVTSSDFISRNVNAMLGSLIVSSVNPKYSGLFFNL